MPDALNDLSRDYPVIVTQAVAWGEMDAYGHVNNVAYFRYFENARLAYFARLGWSIAEKPAGVGPIVTAVQARFRRPLAFPDTISIGARLQSIEEDRFTLEHCIVSHTRNEIVTIGQGTIVTYDYATNQKVKVPDDMRSRIEELG